MPWDLPAYGFEGLDIIPELGITSERSEGGMIVTSRRSDPYLKGTMTTRLLWPDDEHPRFLAFLLKSVDLHMLVDFVHPRYPYPRAYDAANWPMVGNAELVSVTDLRHIVVSGLIVGLILKAGDRLSLVQGNVICHRWIATDVVVLSAISQTLELTPRLPFGVFVAGAAVVLKEPKMRFLIVPGSWSIAEAVGPTAISFDISESLT